MIRPMMSMRINSSRTMPMEMINMPSGTNTPSRFGDGVVAMIGMGADSFGAGSMGAEAVAPVLPLPGSTPNSSLSTSNAFSPACSAASSGPAGPSGTGTIISPAHFGQRTTVPALRRAIPIS
jgi:hypothetical protein